MSQKQDDTLKLKAVMKVITELLPGLGVTLFVFKFNKPGMAHYISNAKRDNMLLALRETYHRISNGQDITAPDSAATPQDN